MLKELTKIEWLSLLSIPERRAPQVLVLRGTRNLNANYAKHKNYFTDVLEVGSPNGIFEDVLIGAYHSIQVGYASVYGDAMASEITHAFGVLGTPMVIQTGCCGALTQGILPGDIVCAASAHCGEGASQYYLSDVQEVEASSDLVELVTGLQNRSVSLHQGPIWTTSALLAEGKKEIEEWAKQGYIAVDMETASTFAVAEYFGMRRLSLLFAFDNPGRGDHILLTDAEKQKRRAIGEQVMIEMLLSLLSEAVVRERAG